MSKKLEGLLGAGNFGLAAASGITAGIAYAKGIDIMPESLYLLSALGVTGFCFGARSSHPEQKLDASVGAVYAGATAIVGVAGFIAAYIGQKLIH
ncbi:MAG: hypothetical protein AABX31_04545 [Nanoarchaeota archaeon]